ncbi:uncharacterized protein LOC100644582 isoform X2 [Bombus terrestris]|uniref:Uncharacterized protein LOC100644582 isoform X2 n=1 Tax=Bombus terrestris TaxID=30195 RepID=A0A9B2MTH0_BOMTE|nr:uncharacterized protein LOC100644582 isoform X2 [Bombus terrestris]
MFERSFRRFVLLCLFVNAICGSPQLRSWDEEEQTRNPRHASCPSCRRERPDTLVSWDTSRREYHGLEPESSPWQSSEPFRRNPIFQQPYNSPFNDPYDGASYDRAIRSRGTPPVTKSTATCKRENPFTIGQAFDFDVAPSQTTSIHSINNPASSYQSHFTVSRTPNRTPYRKPNFYDLIKDQSDLVPSSKLYADYGLTNSESSMNNLRRQSSALANDEEDLRNLGAGKEFSVSTGPDKYFGDYGLSSSQSAFGHPRKSSNFGVRKDFEASLNNEASFNNFRRSSGLSISNEEYFRNFGTKKDFGMGELNVFRTTQKVAGDGVEIVNSSRWEKQLEKHEDHESYEIDENGEQMGAEMVEQMDDSYQGNEQLESREAMQQEEIKRKGDVTSEDNNSRDKSGFSGNRSLGEDSPKTRLMQMETIGDDDVSEESTIETMSGI